MRERSLLWLSLCALAMTSCGQREHRTPTTLASVAPTASTAQPRDSAPDPARVVHWVEAVQREEWDVAEHELDALPLDEKSKPEILYVRARAALARGNAKDTLSLLEGLEGSLPLLAQDIARWRAEAKLDVGPYGEAGEYFAARGTASSLLRAAEAFERAKDVPRARALCTKATSLDRTRLEEAAARACRIRLADPADKSTLSDARWVAVRAPDAPGVREADGALARMDPAHPLTGEELLTRAHVLADSGRTDEALHVLDRLSGAPPPRVARLDALRVRGDVLDTWKRRASWTNVPKLAARIPPKTRSRRPARSLAPTTTMTRFTA
jgi:soluble lytic murein transglycosylase